MAVTLADIQKADGGAQFVNADLHVHSYGASRCVGDTTMTPEAIVDSAIAMGIRVLALTDHNSDANTERSIAYAQQKHAGEILVLAGLEITTAHGHLLVYFSPTQTANARNLLAKLNIVGSPGDGDAHTTMSMADAIREAERLGGICVAAHIDRSKTGFDTLAAGFPNWKRDILVSAGLYGLECDAPASLKWYSDADEQSPNGAERTKLLAARKDNQALIGRPCLAHIQGSDAHTLAEFSATRTDKPWIRLKLDELTYEAFRTAFTDAEARIRAVAAVPRSVPRILGMHVTGGFLDGECYRFSDNLTCIIGGRGTGKSTALQTLAYGLGMDDDFASHGNCPGTVVVYCQDQAGVLYRYERVQGASPVVKAKDDGDIEDVPVDAFRVEFYRQGELAEVAKNPLKQPGLLQEFLDRHLVLADLFAREAQLVSELEQNSAQLIPLEANAATISQKNQLLSEANKKLTIAETGKLKDIAAAQTQLANEKSLAKALASVATDYTRGISLASSLRDYGQLEAMATPLTDATAAKAVLTQVKQEIESVNAFLKQKEGEICSRLTTAATVVNTLLNQLKQSQAKLESDLNAKIAELQKKGLTGSITELTNLLSQKSALMQEISKIKTQSPQLEKLRTDRKQMLSDLSAVRNEIMSRRRSQLGSINPNLAETIQDFIVAVRYEPSGIIGSFKQFLSEKMHGTYFPDALAATMCAHLDPPQLAQLLLNQDIDHLVSLGGLSREWATRMCEKLRYYNTLHTLECMWKPPCPVISIKTKSATPKSIPVDQLSDGQKHTILLTIAMLAESNIPLVIDQPEDDLDNAFVFTAVVKTLRSIKERRQVILVTHNANIAVLGDAELLLPMRRNGDIGEAFDRGSIDKVDTKRAALNILEGGKEAFHRREVMYAH